jgi:3-oxoacyl-[acyl-carrier-protein] synthase-3
MNGPELITFAADNIPNLTKELLEKSGIASEDIDYYLLHQATLKMIDDVSFLMSWPKEKVPLYMRNIGNTVSSTIPLLIEHMRNAGTMTPGKQSLLVGFGVGLSASMCVWKETFCQK